MRISRFRQTARRAILPALSAFVIVLSGCTAPAMLKPASDTSGAIAILTRNTFILAAIVFVIVEFLLVYATFRFRRRKGDDGLPRQIEGNTAIEIGWTAFPAVVLAIVFALTVGTLGFLTTPPQKQPNPSISSNVINVTVIGHRWWWEFQYPDLHVTTANEIHVPVGATINFKVQSADVIHSFWVPEMGGKSDAVPGHDNFTWWKVTQAGRYTGHCTEYCGEEHALMAIIVVAESPDQFQAWVKDQQAPPIVNNLSGDAKNGMDVVMSHACISCHTIQGTKAVGKLGPDLSHFGSRSTFGGASFENNGVNVAAWVLDPQKMKPGNDMPALGLTPAQAQEVAVFLESLK